MVAVVGFAGLVIQPIVQTWKFCRTPGRLSKVKRTPLMISLGVLAVILALVCYVPLPHHIDCAFEIRPSQAGLVYAGTPGQIEWTVSPKEYVNEDDAVAILRNPDLEIRLADLRGRQEIAEVELRNLSYRSRNDAALKAQIDTQEELLAAIELLREKTEEEIKANCTGTRSGYVIPPNDRPAENSQMDACRHGWVHPGAAKPRGHAHGRGCDLRDRNPKPSKLYWSLIRVMFN